MHRYLSQGKILPNIWLWSTWADCFICIFCKCQEMCARQGFWSTRQNIMPASNFTILQLQPFKSFSLKSHHYFPFLVSNMQSVSARFQLCHVLNETKKVDWLSNINFGFLRLRTEKLKKSRGLLQEYWHFFDLFFFSLNRLNPSQLSITWALKLHRWVQNFALVVLCIIKFIDYFFLIVVIFFQRVNCLQSLGQLALERLVEL